MKLLFFFFSFLFNECKYEYVGCLLPLLMIFILLNYANPCILCFGVFVGGRKGTKERGESSDGT